MDQANQRLTDANRHATDTAAKLAATEQDLTPRAWPNPVNVLVASRIPLSPILSGVTV
jgi:hypothetical protein